MRYSNRFYQLQSGKMSRFLSRMARIDEFHECFSIHLNGIRVIRPLVAFVIENWSVVNLGGEKASFIFVPARLG